MTFDGPEVAAAFDAYWERTTGRPPDFWGDPLVRVAVLAWGEATAAERERIARLVEAAGPLPCAGVRPVHDGRGEVVAVDLGPALRALAARVRAGANPSP